MTDPALATNPAPVAIVANSGAIVALPVAALLPAAVMLHFSRDTSAGVYSVFTSTGSMLPKVLPSFMQNGKR